ncbi:sigma-w pathway protein ysdB [Bacillus canaveralius]|uniref:Sigma-w pathway protein ysdB n=1 Tax=Bacillus canaveralius TaxID=1403243 RepID=A0A2N5GJY3_9BACI|nr:MULTISPECIES: sigma-w pathway protein ysdB [Bacillus]PLR81529.1 sigma-w pathway protein ysdB [Bacillus canaveralius]PLR82379.1 sigma-w pathway protein ysdB [Bacillus sp. V33-4]PLR93911.1 sigma-w pathway protein ysdB [Bacillus canaveralius]RSK52544.1 sigma-w pathway protein ysdB [Bacillus canaveralius]
MMWLLRFILFALIIFIIYRSIKYLLNPKRKLELAHEQKRYFLLDDANNVRKNFLITYKGVLFEGEKYLGTTDNAFEIVSIFIWPKSTAALKGMTRDDFLFIEEDIHEIYPNSQIDWKSPIKEFLKKSQSPGETI